MVLLLTNRELSSQRRETLASKLKQALAYTEKLPDKVRKDTEEKKATIEQELKNIEDQILALEDTRKEI